MAVTKLWSVTERLGQVIDYATNPEKTSANIKRPIPLMAARMCRKIAMCRNLQTTSLFTDTT